MCVSVCARVNGCWSFNVVLRLTRALLSQENAGVEGGWMDFDKLFQNNASFEYSTF